MRSAYFPRMDLYLDSNKMCWHKLKFIVRRSQYQWYCRWRSDKSSPNIFFAHNQRMAADIKWYMRWSS